MKHIISKTVFKHFIAVLLLILGTIHASAQYQMVVHTDDGLSYPFSAERIDSVSFVLMNPDDNGNDEDETTVTGNATEITNYTATISAWANILDNLSTDLEVGIIFTTTGTPSKSNGTQLTVSTSSLSSDAKYTIELTKLSPSTTYYYRSFVYQSGIWFYGDVKEFTTKGLGAELVSGEVSKLTCYSAKVNCSVKIDASTQYSTLTYGICYGTTPEPTINNSRIQATTKDADGNYVCQLRALLGSTTYYYRAYAYVDGFLSYSSTRSFTTKDDDVVTTGDIDLQTFTIKSSLKIGSGAYSTLELGVCYGTNELPTVSDQTLTSNEVDDENNFVIIIAEIPYGQVYYRAYVSIDGSLHYGEIKMFEGNSVTTGDIDLQSYSIKSHITISDGYKSIRYGVCYGSNEMPTIEDKYISTTEIDDEKNYLITLTGIPFGKFYYRSYVSIDDSIYYGAVKMCDGNSITTGDIDTLTYNIKSYLKNSKGYKSIQCGICYSNNENPTISNDKIIGNEMNDNIYVVTLKNTKYDVVYYRAFVTVDNETYYGEVKSFKNEYIDLSITSGPISGLNEDRIATISLRTFPFDLLLRDNFAQLVLCDTLGNPLESSFKIVSKEFMPDSTWLVKVEVMDEIINDTFIAFSITNDNYTIISSPVQLLLKVNFNMRSVRTSDGLTMSYDGDTKTYSGCLPTVTDFSTQKIIFFHNGDYLTVGDSILQNNQINILDVSKPITVTLWKYNLGKNYTIKFTNTGLPVVRIETNGQSVTRRDTWVPGATMRIELPDGTVNYEGTLSLMGQGDQTWTDFDKKPYALQLDAEANLLGMHKQKHWILEANVKDRTLMRNDLAYWISKQTNLPYTVSGEFVELVWNGQHLGNYYLCEQPRIDDDRIDIHNPNLEEPEKGGFFIAIDAFLDYNDPKWADKGKDIGFYSSRYNMPYMFKDPDKDENGNPLSTTSAAFKYIQKYVNTMETAISNASSTNHEWANYLDICSAVDFALIQEIVMNPDAYNTWPKNGPKNTFIYKDSAGLMCYGPVWDFDYHTFTLYNDYEYNSGAWSNTENQRLYQWEILKLTNKGGKYYFSDLLKDPEFKALLIERWNIYKVIWKEGFDDYVDQIAEKIRLSETYNQKLWGYPSKQNGDWQLSFDDAVKAIKTAFKKRLQWIDENIGNL